jgi:hypothetical protein
MRANPFPLPNAASWLTPEQIPSVLSRLLQEAEHSPLISEHLLWLGKMDAIFLSNDSDSQAKTATVMAFFSSVTHPIAAMIGALYTTPILRSLITVWEILHRMAQAVEAVPLPLDMVIGVCTSFFRQRIGPIQDRIQPQGATWKLSWHQSRVPIHCATGSVLPLVILVIEEESEKVLSFRCVEHFPTSAELSLTLYDALVYSSMKRVPFLWELYPPTHLRVQGSPPEGIVQVANKWEIEVEEVPSAVCPFLCQWEHELTDRLLDSVQYLRIFDRACERAFGYAPFLMKQRFARQVGRCISCDNDPTWQFSELRSLLPSYPVTIGGDGTLEWRGLHYRDTREDVLRYWAHEAVVIRPSPFTEAAIWVYWKNSILCYATADELRNKDDTYRPYWFPYPRLGE